MDVIYDRNSISLINCKAKDLTAKVKDLPSMLKVKDQSQGQQRCL